MLSAPEDTVRFFDIGLETPLVSGPDEESFRRISDTLRLRNGSFGMCDPDSVAGIILAGGVSVRLLAFGDRPVSTIVLVLVVMPTATEIRSRNRQYIKFQTVYIPAPIPHALQLKHKIIYCVKARADIPFLM